MLLVLERAHAQIIVATHVGQTRSFGGGLLLLRRLSSLATATSSILLLLLFDSAALVAVLVLVMNRRGRGRIFGTLNDDGGRAALLTCRAFGARRSFVNLKHDFHASLQVSYVGFDESIGQLSISWQMKIQSLIRHNMFGFFCYTSNIFTHIYFKFNKFNLNISSSK